MTDEPAEPVADARDLADVVAFRDALGALPEAQQDIVILHELEEYTLKETAALLAIPFDTAKDRLRRAREVLRERMHADPTAAVTAERRATSQIAKAAAPAVAIGVLAAVSRNAAAAGSAATATSAIASKLVIGGVLAIGIVVGVVADRVIARGPKPAEAQVVTRELPERVANVEPDAGASTPDAAAPVDAAPVAPASHANAEAQLIERARVALRTGTADDAIRTLMSHERRFPDGQLAEERDVLLVEAYLAAGNVKLARERLDHYQATYPNGLHKQRAADAARELERRAPEQ